MSTPSTSLLDAPRRRTSLGDWCRRALSDSFLRKGALTIFDQAIVSGTSFATSVIVGRACSKEDLGIYFLALSIVMFARTAQEQVVSAPYMIYCNRRRGIELANYAGSTLVHQGGVILLAWLGLGGLLAALAFGLGPGGLQGTVLVLMGAVPFLLLREFVRGYAFAHFRAATAILVDLAVSLLQVGGLLALALWGTLSSPAVYAVMGGACLVVCGAWWWSRRGEFRFLRPRVVADWIHNWAFAKWALASQLVGSSATYLMPWVLALVHGGAETGVLAACTSLVGLSNMFVMGLSHYLSPKAAHSFAEGGVPELRRVLWKTFAIFTASLGAFCLTCLMAGDWLIVLVYGEKYTDAGAALVMTILALGMWMNSMSITAGNGLWAMERPAANFRSDVVSLATTIVAMIVFVPGLEVVGIALASLIGGSVGVVLRTITLRGLMREVESETPIVMGETP